MVDTMNPDVEQASVAMNHFLLKLSFVHHCAESLCKQTSNRRREDQIIFCPVIMNCYCSVKGECKRSLDFKQNKLGQKLMAKIRGWEESDK